MKIGTLEIKFHKKPKKEKLIDKLEKDLKNLTIECQDRIPTLDKAFDMLEVRLIKLEKNIELITKVLDAITKK